MTLPTGQIGMSQVNVELGRSASAQLDLNGTNPSSTIRTLFGKASGQIALSDGHGKSSTPAGYSNARRPSYYSGTPLLSPIANAYDTSGTTVDSGTSAYYNGYGSGGPTFYGFGSGTVTGICKVRWNVVTSGYDYIDGWDDWGDPIYAHGSSGVGLWWNSGYVGNTTTSYYTDGQTSGGFVEAILAGTFVLSDFQIQVGIQAFDIYSGIGQHVRMGNTVYVSDVVILY